jgi:hypothetical protein
MTASFMGGFPRAARRMLSAGEVQRRKGRGRSWNRGVVARGLDTNVRPDLVLSRNTARSESREPAPGNVVRVRLGRQRNATANLPRRSPSPGCESPHAGVGVTPAVRVRRVPSALRRRRCCGQEYARRPCPVPVHARRTLARGSVEARCDRGCRPVVSVRAPLELRTCRRCRTGRHCPSCRPRPSCRLCRPFPFRRLPGIARPNSR